jgi:hypothetical protein
VSGRVSSCLLVVELHLHCDGTRLPMGHFLAIDRSVASANAGYRNGVKVPLKQYARAGGMRHLVVWQLRVRSVVVLVPCIGKVVIPVLMSAD